MASTLSQDLIDKLVSYDFSHEAFEAIKLGLVDEVGETWHSGAAEIASNIDIPNKETLVENITQIVNYDGALAAWEEGHELLSHKDDITLDYLNERLPAIEYWLGFFDGGGDELLQSLKSLINEKEAEPQKVEETQASEIASPVVEEEVENIHPVADEEIKDVIANAESSVENIVDEDVIEKSVVIDDEADIISTKDNTQAENQNNLESFFETSSDLEAVTEENADKINKQVEQTIDVDETNLSDEVPTQTISDKPEVIDNVISDTVAEEVSETIEELPAAEVKDEPPENDAVVEAEIEAEKPEIAISESIASIPLAQSKKGTGLEAIPMEKPLESRNPTHWEWYVNRFLRLNDYYDQTISRISARCVGLGGISLSDYPYFEYILDVLSEIIDMGKQIIAKPAVHSLLKDKIPRGVKGLEDIIKSYEVDFNNNAPPEMLDKSSDMAMVKARLGQLAENIVEEDIGPAPDGFVVENEPSVSFP